MAKAINPYNFVPFYNEGNSFDVPPERRALSRDVCHVADGETVWYDGDLQSGWIDISLYTKTPLIVPDADHYKEETVVDKNDNLRQHKSYPFFRLPDDNQLAIPGSELRGMLRAMYEAASNSCFPFFQQKPKTPISQRTPIYGAFRKRGLLGYDIKTKQWTLYGAKVYIIKTTGNAVADGTYQSGEQEYKTGDKVCFSSKDGELTQLGTGTQTGYLQFNVPVNKNQDYHVAVLEPLSGETAGATDVPYSWDPGDKSAYQSIYGSVYESAKKPRVRGMRVTTMDDLKKAIKDVAGGNGQLVPVYYFCVKRDNQPLYYLSGAAVGRVLQKRSWEEIMSEHSTCTSLSALCPACALFGTVQDGGTKGRLRFTDAVIKPESKPELQTHTLQILSTPRHSSFEFYLRKPDPAATYWNYDYYGVKKELPDGREVTEYRDLARATPRGRKFYWHCRPARDMSRKSHLNATMESVDKAAFRFRVYFDRITEEQLSDFLWLITLGENDPEGKYWHKLGHAKPLGYGSVKLVVTNCTRRVLSADGSFSVTLETEVCPKELRCHFPDNKTMESILRMCDSSSTEGVRVAYLTGVDNNGRKNIYTWFQHNRDNPKSVKTLAEPWEKDLTMETERLKTASGELENNGNSHINGGTRPVSRGRMSPDEATFNREAKQYPPGTSLMGTIDYISERGDTFLKLDNTVIKGYAFLKDGHSYKAGDRIQGFITNHNKEKKTFKVRIERKI